MQSALGLSLAQTAARLAMLSMLPEETAAVETELEAMVAFMKPLSESVLGNTSLKESSRPPIHASLREDQIAQSLPACEALQNAKTTQGAYFCIPKTYDT